MPVFTLLFYFILTLVCNNENMLNVTLKLTLTKPNFNGKLKLLFSFNVLSFNRIQKNLNKNKGNPEGSNSMPF